MSKNIFIVDSRYIETARRAFGAFGHFLPSVRCPGLPKLEAYHPDMALFADGSGTVICAPSVYEEYNRLLLPLGVELVQGRLSPKGSYPDIVAYNVLYAGDYAFARFKGTEPQIVERLNRRGVALVSVAQGYARCSALSFGDSLITADASIAKAAERCGLSVLKIEPGHIALPGYEYGFIGGASGLLNRHTVGFFGDLAKHPDGAAIRRFITERGFSICEIPGESLTDVGTILGVRVS